MNITKLIDTLQSYKNKGCNRVLISNNNFSLNQYIKKLNWIQIIQNRLI